MFFQNELPEIVELPPFKIFTIRKEIQKKGRPVKVQRHVYLFFEFLLSHANQEIPPDAIASLSSTSDKERAARQCYQALRHATGTEIEDYVIRTRACKPQPSKYQLRCIDLLPKPLHVFPRTDMPSAGYFLPSWVGTDESGCDSVKSVLAFDPFQDEERPTIGIANPHTLSIPFHHCGRVGGGWWSAAVALNIAENKEWKAMDVMPYGKLLFEGRAFANSPTDTGRTAVRLRIRLEDKSEESSHKSGHQATSWITSPPITSNFRTIEISLAEFDWAKAAWPKENTADVDRKNILQIVFGQDHTIDAETGVIELRNIRFEI
jgi:hypothetical protein